MGRIIKGFGELTKNLLDRLASYGPSTNGDGVYSHSSTRNPEDTNNNGLDDYSNPEVIHHPILVYSQDNFGPTLPDASQEVAPLEPSYSPEPPASTRESRMQEYKRRATDRNEDNSSSHTFEVKSITSSDLEDDGKSYRIDLGNNLFIDITKVKKRTIGRLKEVVYDVAYRKHNESGKKRRKTDKTEYEDLKFIELPDQQIDSLISGVRGYYRSRIDGISIKHDFDIYSDEARRRDELGLELRDILVALKERLEVHQSNDKEKDKKKNGKK